MRCIAQPLQPAFTRLSLDIRVTFAEIKTVSNSLEIDTLEDVSGLDISFQCDFLREI